MERVDWSLRPDVAMDEMTAGDVAKIACALKSLSVYTVEALEDDDIPESLKNTVDDGVEAIKRIFVW